MSSTVGNTISAVFVSWNDNSPEELFFSSLSLHSRLLSGSTILLKVSAIVAAALPRFGPPTKEKLSTHSCGDYFHRWLIDDARFEIIPKPDGFIFRLAHCNCLCKIHAALNGMKLIFIFSLSLHVRASIFFHIRLSWVCVNRRLQVKTAFNMQKKSSDLFIFQWNCIVAQCHKWNSI